MSKTMSEVYRVGSCLRKPHSTVRHLETAYDLWGKQAPELQTLAIYLQAPITLQLLSFNSSHDLTETPNACQAFNLRYLVRPTYQV